MARYQYIAITSARPGQIEAYEDWYDNRHIKDVAAIPGVVSARRYRLINDVNNVENRLEPPRWNSVAIYELDTHDPAAIARTLRELSGTVAMPHSDAIADEHITLIAEVAADI